MRNESGKMMIELLLAMALAAAMLPFLIRQEEARVRHAENVKAAHDITTVKVALERYMEDNKLRLMSTIGRNIERVRLSDLEDYGLAPGSVAGAAKYQLRIVKTADRGGRAFLQGIVVMDSENVSPVRTREIASIGGAAAGFADGNRTYGAFGTWGASTNIWNAKFSDTSVIDVTNTLRSGDEYLMRVPSNSPGDATMLSNLSMGGHSITEARTIVAESTRFAEFINSGVMNASRLVIENRPTMDGRIIVSGETTVAGVLSSDSRSIETERMTVPGISRFNAVTARELWAGDLSLSGISVRSERDNPAVLSVNRTIDMIGGRVTALLVAVGFAGSVTPRLVVRDRIEDAVNQDYFWNVALGDAVFSDLEIPVLNKMMQTAIRRESESGTEATRIMSPIANNANSTVADFMRALVDIESRVTAKYNQLNLK
ncbi:MAG: hypothetical protein FWG80_03360 [Alphaproteobacteria bacterium]|nr:hypothetical protein [Alphaproteobacteria bacterium]